MQCPLCRKDLVAHSGGSSCPEHGPIEAKSLTLPQSSVTSSVVQPLRIFLSYGHEPPEHVEVALRIKADLKARGHKVWFDIEKLRSPLDWEKEIEQAIVASDRVVLLMTPHSVRRADRRAAADDPAARDGYCLNEIAKAVERNKIIVPIMLAWVDQGPPTSICRIQWLDMQDCVPLGEKEQAYAQSKFPLLVEAIESNRLDFEGGWTTVWRHLKPLDFQVEMERHIAGFHGREWLLGKAGAISRWLDDPSSARVFWLLGGPGVGKSAIATQLAHRRGDVAAVHFCVHGHADFTSPRKALLSIAYQLATHLPAYHRILQQLDLREEGAKDSATLFRNLLVLNQAYSLVL